MRYFQYILESRKGSYYIGSTNNLERRLVYHNAGKVRSTRNGRPWRVIYSESFDTLSEARKRESHVKGWKSRSAIERLVKTALSSSLA